MQRMRRVGFIRDNTINVVLKEETSVITATFLGHSCFTFSDGKNTLLIDPYLTGNALAAAKPESLSPTAILVTHAHGDHLGDAISIAKRSHAQIISTAEVAGYCSSQGAKVHPMHIGGAFQFPFGRIKLTLALHGSSIEGKCCGNPCGFLITMEDKTIYHAGDTGLFGDMELIGRMNRIDLAALPIGDNFTMGIDDAVEAARMLHPNLAIPMHYNTFDVIQADPAEFVVKTAALGIHSKILRPGESVSI